MGLPWGIRCGQTGPSSQSTALSHRFWGVSGAQWPGFSCLNLYYAAPSTQRASTRRHACLLYITCHTHAYAAVPSTILSPPSLYCSSTTRSSIWSLYFRSSLPTARVPGWGELVHYAPLSGPPSGNTLVISWSGRSGIHLAYRDKITWDVKTDCRSVFHTNNNNNNNNIVLI